MISEFKLFSILFEFFVTFVVQYESWAPLLVIFL
jgi:hypothetical protein